MPSKITVGCCVDALVGPFYALEKGNKRRKRARISGIVIASVPDGKWKVYWSSVGKVSVVSVRSLQFNKKADGSMLRDMDASALIEREFLGEQAGLDAWFLTQAGGLLGGGQGPDSSANTQNNLADGGLLGNDESRINAPASNSGNGSGRIDAPADSIRNDAVADGPQDAATLNAAKELLQSDTVLNGGSAAANTVGGGDGGGGELLGDAAFLVGGTADTVVGGGGNSGALLPGDEAVAHLGDELCNHREVAQMIIAANATEGRRAAAVAVECLV